jgi:hypothetical protein
VINGLQRVRPGVKVAPTIAAMTPDTTAVPVETSGSHQ